MKLNYNQFLALVYADIFDYPLTGGEMKLWSVSSNYHEFVTNFHEYDKKIQSKEGFYFLKGREKLVELRKKREEISRKKLIKLTQLIKLIEKVPTVRGILVTGSVAAGNAKEDADLDLMVVTSPGTMWATRLIVVGTLKLLGKYRGDEGDQGDRVCTNLFLDTNHLRIKEKNLYTAHEVVLVKCLFDRGGIQGKWIRENEWVKEYLPKAYSYKVLRIKYNGDGEQKTNFPLYVIRYTLYAFLEVSAFTLQYLYMRGRITNESVGWGYAFFHPKDLSKEVLKKFNLKIKKLRLA